MKLNEDYLKTVECYPSSIRQQLDSIFQAVLEIVGTRDLRAIFLIGSAARDELSIERKSDSLIVHSDYEFIIVMDKVTTYVVKSLRSAMSELELEFANSSPLFSIDYGLIPYKKLLVTPASLWSLELSDKGICVWGEDIRDRIPAVTAQNIDLGNLMWLASVRLWSYTKNMPLDCDGETPSRDSLLIKDILLARNLLDVVTIFLPHRGIMVAGYKERQVTIENLSSSALGGLGQRVDFLRRMLEFKLNPCSEHNLSDINPSVLVFIYIELFQSLNSDLSWDYRPSSLPEFIQKLKKGNRFRHSLLKEVRWLANSLYYLSRNPFSLSLGEKALWFCGKARYDFFGFIISFHMAKYWLEEDCRNEEFLHLADVFLSRAIGKTPCNNTSIESLRERSLLFMKSWYESNRN